MIAKTVVVGAEMGMESLRQLDVALRLVEMREALGSERAQVASDTTIARVAKQWEIREVERIVRAVWRKGRTRGVLGKELGGEDRTVGVIDGTTLGGQMRSVMVEAGKAVACVGVEPIVKRGKELPSSMKLIRAVAREEGKGFVELLGGDGLYACERFWRTCRRAGVKGWVKTGEEGLSIIQDANGLFDARRLPPGVEYQEGVDALRGCRYRVWAVEEMPWSQTNMKLKVGRVEEEYFKGRRKGHTERFWVLSQDQEMKALPLRELAHGRWFIENNGFKAANEQAHTKHTWSRDEHTARIFSLLQMIGIMLMTAYRHWLETFKEELKSLWDHGVLSMKMLRMHLWRSLNPKGRQDTS